MIRKSGSRFSGKIMRKQNKHQIPVQPESDGMVSRSTGLCG
jgi:hypothetical protein